MCELFALSSSTATEVSFSLDEFSKHGGLTNHHRHGWGIAFYAKNSARIIKEASPASDSACLNFVKFYSIKSRTIMSHIRYATQGEVSLRNTQPFSRELAGREHVFIHNGDLDLSDSKFHNTRFQPMGDTDSEKSFCYLMCNMAKIWDKGEPELAQRYQVFLDFADKMYALGLANFIYSDSEYIYIYSHKRIVKDKNNPDKKVTLPGLHILTQGCPIDNPQSNISGLQMKNKDPEHIILVSSVPLNEGNWRALETNQSMVLKDGKVVIGD